MDQTAVLPLFNLSSHCLGEANICGTGHSPIRYRLLHEGAMQFHAQASMCYFSGKRNRSCFDGKLRIEGIVTADM